MVANSSGQPSPGHLTIQSKFKLPFSGLNLTSLSAIPETLLVRVNLVLMSVQQRTRLELLVAEAAGIDLLHGGHAVHHGRLQLELPVRPRPDLVPLDVRPDVGLLVE